MRHVIGYWYLPVLAGEEVAIALRTLQHVLSGNNENNNILILLGGAHIVDIS